MRLAQPAWLLLLLLIPLYLRWDAGGPRLAWPTLDGFARAPRGLARLGTWLPRLLVTLALGCTTVALARPQTIAGRQRLATRGVGIVVALDRSSSMDAVDFPTPDGGKESRLAAARRTLVRFVEGRPDDLIGLVAFANYPDLACPPTLDHAFLVDVAGALQSAAHPGEDGTNIGDAVVWALDALRGTPPPRKVLVLLTDGENRPQGVDPPPIDPLAAARLAGALGVRLHTIAIGRGGLLRRDEPVTGLSRPVGEVEGPNLRLLESMAELGGGRAFVATDGAALAGVFSAIDDLERTRIQGIVRTRYHDHYPAWLGAAAALLGVRLLLTATRLRRLP
jgi:Ca-activated chloride channel family protein